MVEAQTALRIILLPLFCSPIHVFEVIKWYWNSDNVLMAAVTNFNKIYICMLHLFHPKFESYTFLQL